MILDADIAILDENLKAVDIMQYMISVMDSRTETTNPCHNSIETYLDGLMIFLILDAVMA